MKEVIDLVLGQLLESCTISGMHGNGVDLESTPVATKEAVVTAQTPSVKYVGFKCDTEVNQVRGVNAGVIFGRIKYEYQGCIGADDAADDQQLDQSMKTTASGSKASTHLWVPMILKTIPAGISFPRFHVYAFVNEAYFYTRLIPFFAEMSHYELGHNGEVAGAAPAVTIHSLFPKMYTSYIEMRESADRYLLVFENLMASHFRPSEVRSFLDVDHLKMMVRRLGQFHAFSFEAKRRSGDDFLALNSLINEIHFSAINKMQNILPALAMRGYLPLLRDPNPKYQMHLQKIAGIIPRVNEFLTELMRDQWKLPMSVICHGDYLQGNVLFKYDQQGKPIDMKMIDLASIKVASPVIDLLMVLYLNADQTTRTKYWNELIDTYYHELCNTFPSSKTPTKASLMKEFHTKALYGYFIASYYLPQIMAADANESSIYEMLPKEYKGIPYGHLPEEILINVCMKAGGDETTRALTNILKDMIDRGFI